MSMKKLNWYYAIDVLTALLLVLLLAAIHFKNQKLLMFFGIDIVLCGSFLIIESRKNPPIPSKVTNNMDEPILAKPENGNTPVQIAPHTEMYGVYGIKANGKVFKLCSGTHVEVKANGEIVTKALSAKFINKNIGGYLNQSPDTNWDELFNA